ncbi:MAG: universal stress protein [Okeania sp. SIO2F4]|uniref:universal stress protein n=1 Tax=Okeania sp. SIO2F4 TaxID=2607790 RepID=UPI00142999CB|nr:universal stress protein [Okeania sp. SIO2F4]NES03607.1 universal stress protein [Okeania sp. SIO2F4]
MFKTVLFPVDRSREAREAAEKVINIVKTYQARLVVISVREVVSQGQEAFHPEMTSEQTVTQLLEEAKALFAEQGIQAETIQREGHPAFTICDVADEIEADLIVIGCRGTGLSEEGATDSVSNRIINLSPCPILVVP